MPKLRQRMFVGCEGDGERALAVALQKFANDEAIPIHLEIFHAHGGAPEDILRRTASEMARKIGLRGRFQKGAFLLLDQDRIDQENCLTRLLAEAKRKKITLVRQQENLECLLGMLLSGSFNIGSHRAKAELTANWPGYQKGFDAPSLKSKLTIARVRESAAIGGEWYELMKRIGFVR